MVEAGLKTCLQARGRPKNQAFLLHDPETNFSQSSFKENS